MISFGKISLRWHKSTVLCKGFVCIPVCQCQLLIIFFASRWTWLHTGKENKDVAVGRREERTTVCSNKQTDDNCRVCCGMVILKSEYNACFKSRYIDHIQCTFFTPESGQGSGGQFNKTFTSVMYKCSYCFQTLKQWLHL